MSDHDPYRKGDVIWAPDPFRPGTRPRLWLVFASDGLPYAGEEYICGVLTRSDLPSNFAVGDAWVSGRDPEKISYCSPWAVATIKHAAIVSPQGRITAAVTDLMIEESIDYLGFES